MSPPKPSDRPKRYLPDNEINWFKTNVKAHPHLYDATTNSFQPLVVQLMKAVLEDDLSILVNTLLDSPYQFKPSQSVGPFLRLLNDAYVAKIQKFLKERFAHFPDGASEHFERLLEDLLSVKRTAPSPSKRAA